MNGFGRIDRSSLQRGGYIDMVIKNGGVGFILQRLVILRPGSGNPVCGKFPDRTVDKVKVDKANLLFIDCPVVAIGDYDQF